MGIKSKSTIYDEIGRIETIKYYIDEILYDYLLFEQGRFKLKPTLGRTLTKVSPTDAAGIRPGEKES